MDFRYRFGRCEFEPAARRLCIEGSEAVLGGPAFDLLQALVERHDRVVGKDELYELVWPGLAVEPNNLQVQVWALRKLLGREAIATVARRGYRFMPAVERLPCDTAAALPAPEAAPPRPADGRRQALALALQRSRLVTLAGSERSTLRQWAQAAAQDVASTMPAGVWQAEAWLLSGPRGPGHTATEALHGLLARLARQRALLLLHGCDGDEKGVQALQALMAQAPSLHLCTTAPHALGLAGEVVFSLPEGAPGAAADEAIPAMPLRWRPRAQ